MTSPDFARMLREAMEAKGLSKRKLGALIGVLSDGRFYDATGIRLIVEGRRRAYDTELVTRLIAVLDLDPADAYEAAGVWPEGLTADGLRRVLADAQTKQAKQHGVRASTMQTLADLRIWRQPLPAAA